jgi:hypothetical protein
MRAMNERNANGLGVVVGALPRTRTAAPPLTRTRTAAPPLTRTRTAAPVGAMGLVCLLVCSACGGGAKGADSPGNCPEGTVLNGSDCVPPSTGSSHASDDSSSSNSASSSKDDGPSGGSAAPPPSSDSPPSGSGTPYQKDAVEIELKRASRQIKANCGSATDDNGTASGPWGKTTAAVTLGRNGHIKEVAVPAPYSGQPEGDCAVNAFKKIQFPPYASSSDVILQWDIEFVKPKH